VFPVGANDVVCDTCVIIAMPSKHMLFLMHVPICIAEKCLFNKTRQFIELNFIGSTSKGCFFASSSVLQMLMIVTTLFLLCN